MRNSAALGVSLTSLSALLSACGSSQRSETDTGGGGKGKLAVGIPVDADTLDPQAFKTIPGYYILANLYDQLIDSAGPGRGRHPRRHRREDGADARAARWSSPRTAGPPPSS